VSVLWGRISIPCVTAAAATLIGDPLVGLQPGGHRLPPNARSGRPSALRVRAKYVPAASPSARYCPSESEVALPANAPAASNISTLTRACDAIAKVDTVPLIAAAAGSSARLIPMTSLAARAMGVPVKTLQLRTHADPV